MNKTTLLMVLILTISCCPLKDKIDDNNSIAGKVVKKPIFTEFYQITTFAIPKKKTFRLSERKNFDLSISNWGTKDLYVPEYFDKSSREHSELYIEVFVKNKDKYVPYKQISKIVVGTIHTDTRDRKVLSTKNFEVLCFKDIQLDAFMKIVDVGEYVAKIYIDLSNFGYFKIIEDSAFFEVVSDSAIIKEEPKVIYDRNKPYDWDVDLKRKKEEFLKRKNKNLILKKKDSL